MAAPARLAVLDRRWTARAAAYPELGAELAGRALARSLRLVVAMAVAQQPRLDVRLWMLFWDLADRWGKVRADGVNVELPLTHEILSHLAGARRPSVSAALTRLAADGRVRREGQRWILSGEPPAFEQDPAASAPRASPRTARSRPPARAGARAAPGGGRRGAAARAASRRPAASP